MSDTTTSAETEIYSIIQDLLTTDDTEDESDELFSGNDCVYAHTHIRT